MILPWPLGHIWCWYPQNSGEHLAYNPSSNHLVGGERTIINLDSNANDGFVDINELLSGMQQKNITPSGTAKRIDVVFASGSTVAFSQPTEALKI